MFKRILLFTLSLTAFAAVVFAQTPQTLVDQLNQGDISGIFLSDYELADDFSIPDAAGWTITQATFSFIGAIDMGLNVRFYANNGNLPGGSPLCSYTLTGVITTTVTLSPPCVLAQGTYWVSLQATSGPNIPAWRSGVNPNASNPPAMFVLSDEFLCPANQWANHSSCISIGLSNMGFALTGIVGTLPDTTGRNPCIATDGRLNAVAHRDCAAPVVVYCSPDEDIVVYGVNPIRQLFRVAQAQINAEGVPATTAAILAQSGGTVLYRLSTGEYQLNSAYADGKPYVIAWRGCNASTLYHLAS